MAEASATSPPVRLWTLKHWLRLNTITYIDAQNRERFWDCCERTTRKPEASADAVVILAVLRSATASPQTLLVKQFRPPVSQRPAALLLEA